MLPVRQEPILDVLQMNFMVVFMMKLLSAVINSVEIMFALKTAHNAAPTVKQTEQAAHVIPVAIKEKK